MVIAPVDILSFSVDTDRVLVEGEIMRNKEFVGIVECSEILY